MSYTSGSHTVFHHRYHIVWAPKYRFKVLRGEVRLRVRDIIKQVCAEMGVTIINGALSQDHVHMFVEIPPHIAVSDFVRRAKHVLSLSKGGAHRARSSRNSNISANAIGDSASGPGDTSPQPAATSPTMSYFSISRSTNLPASAGSYSVTPNPELEKSIL